MGKTRQKLCEDATMIVSSINSMLDDYFALTASYKTYSSVDFSEGRIFFSKEPSSNTSFSISLNLDSRKDKEDTCWIRKDKSKGWFYEDLHPLFDNRMESITIVLLEKLYNELSKGVKDHRQEFNTNVDRLLEKTMKSRNLQVPKNVNKDYNNTNINLSSIKKDIEAQLREEFKGGMMVLQTEVNNLRDELNTFQSSKPKIKKIVAVK